MDIIAVLIMSGLILLAGILVFLVKINRKLNIPQKNSIIEENIVDNPQVYKHWHIDHLINVEIERAERYQFKFSLLAIDFGSLFSDKKDYELKKMIFSLLKRSTRIIDFIIKGKKRGLVFLILPETDEKETSIVVERIRNNIKNSVIGKSLNKIKFGYVCYPADATSKDLIMEYIYSVMSKVDEEQPVKSYGSTLEHN